MARFVLILLLVIVGALVVALFFDHRGKREARFDRLRWTFLHGTPLAGYSRGASSLAELSHPGGLHFRAPTSWAIDMVDGARATVQAEPPGGRRVQVEVIGLHGSAGGSVTDALKSLAAEGERSIEALSNGHTLMKSVDSVPASKGVLASYTWRLARAAPDGRLQMAVFRLRLPVESASDLIAQSDLATLDRQVREARLVEATAPSSAGG